MSAASDAVQQIIDNALQIANDKSQAADTYAGQAMTIAESYAQPGNTQVSFAPKQPEFHPYVPVLADGSNSPLFNSMYHQITQDLADAFEEFYAKYFPDFCDYMEDAQRWICQVFEVGGTGMNPVVEDQIWQRDRARVLDDADRVDEEIDVTWAGRGYPLPPGAMTYQHLRADQQMQDKIAQASRDVAIKQAEIEIENIRFAVDKAIGLRVAAINAAGEYIRSLAIGPQIASQFAMSSVNAQSALIASATAYYNAQVNLEQLKWDVVKTNGTFGVEGQDLFMKSFGLRTNNATGAALASAKAAGDAAAAALNALHSSAAISSIENT